MKRFTRRLLATAVFAGMSGTPSRAAEIIRLAVQKTGKFAWELAVMAMICGGEGDFCVAC
jgi:NitT/TauT family transport system substrate-binding protein